ncbi:FAD-dependent oxidoreductase [Dysgonomonas sp. Marseille-P4361]|uniref:FAD-dependent oxidoreductase n=1 Tax=Dysgonomonas sp. Marseille-P4361 TaxID=2161820 RepID=UPI000D5539CB|nr:FAD-dependent oxidoreductase [Dysgonomonas sp. Marseille-P4361]
MSDTKKISRRKFFKIAAATGAVGTVAAAGIYKATEFSSNAKGKIVIIGGGCAGLSMAALLHRWLKEPDITVIDPSDRQYYQPGFTLVASGVYEPDDVWKDQKDCMPSGVTWVKDVVKELDPSSKAIKTEKNGKISYDFLVLAPGLQIDWDRTEGISQSTLGQGNAHTIYDFEGAQKTWKAIQEFAQKGGRGVFTDTYTKHKCGGAPKKICLLTEHHARKQNTRDKVTLDYFTADKELYDVPYFTPRLLEIYNERNVSITLHTRVKGIDTAAKRVHMERIETIGDEKIVTPVIEDYDFLHFTPPMSAPTFVREAGLSWTEGGLAADGWVMVDKETLIHKTYPNIVCLGDCAGIPTSKTSAAVRKQVPVAAMNLVLTMEGKTPDQKYNGYAACPIITDYGHVLLCEFDYDKNPQISFPFTMLDMSKEQAAAWQLKVEVLKPLYYQGMLNGYGF